MDLITGLIDFVIHIDKHLGEMIAQYGALTYAILFLIVFAETGFVVTPFLPGDSLLFAAGAFAALGRLDVVTIIVIVTIAAVVGDNVNFWIGRHVGPAAVASGRYARVLKPEYLAATEAFYVRHGGKTIILARFVPIVRTFAPFMAGVGEMPQRRFFAFNVIGALLWVPPFVSAGYLFGNVPIVRDNFSLVVLAIVLVSILPGIYGWARHHLAARRARSAAA